MKSSALGRTVLALSLMHVAACTKSSEATIAKAREHARELAKVSESDVREVRSGLPDGAKALAKVYADTNPADDPQQARRALERARNEVQDLRVAKSTFFALVMKDGTVVRTNQEQDSMAGKNVFSAFPELRKAGAGEHVETLGAMPEAAAVKGRADAQWVAAEPIKVGTDVKALYVTGWSWSAYAYRLETALRSSVQSSIGEQTKMPLLYVYLVVGNAVYGAPISPEVNAQAISRQTPLEKLGPDGSFAAQLEISDREFGFAAQRAPSLGRKVAIAVLRSET
jgi:hypothetical protein